MTIARSSIRKSTVTWLMALVFAGGGIAVFDSMAKFEDPEFTIKTAMVFTPYPGATPLEVEEEVTDRIESAIQQLGQVDEVRSESFFGTSRITVDIKNNYGPNELPQIWDELRRKVNDVQGQLPPGAGPSIVNDDFGDVYGILYALTGDGFSMPELKEYAKELRRELLKVEGVAKIAFDGVIDEAIYVEIPRARLAAMGTSAAVIYQTLATQNEVVSAGSSVVGDERVRFRVSGQLDSVAAIESLLISDPQADQVLRLGDLAHVSRGPVDPVKTRVYFDGHPAIHLGISAVGGGNVVAIGEAISQRMTELTQNLPHGVEVNAVSLQGDAVTVAINGFVINLVEALAIVIGVLMLVIGLRPGIIIGLNLLLIVCGTLLIMYLQGVALQRISLGALIIAMGMLVDNAIVVVDGVLVRMRRGEQTEDAADAVVEQTKWPLLGATVIAVLAFSAIGLSPDSTGEYCRSLFEVVLYSLLLSWLFAITITPVMCVQWLKAPSGATGEEPAEGAFLGGFRKALAGCIRFRSLSCLALVGMLVAALWGFGFVDRSFFPSSARPQFILDYWLPAGTDIERTDRELREIEAHIAELDGVSGTTTIVGKGALRFLLTYNAEQANSNYGTLLVDIDDISRTDELFPEIYSHINDRYPDALPYMQKFQLGPGGGGAVGVRFSGDDPVALRNLANQTIDLMKQDHDATNIQLDWQAQSKLIQVAFNEARGRLVGITRADLNATILEQTEGRRVGVYREGDELIPIIARPPPSERNDMADVLGAMVYPANGGPGVPILQVVENADTVLDDTIIGRKNRTRTIEINCDPRYGTASQLLARLKPQIEAIQRPIGYDLEWGGEAADSGDAQASLMVPMAVSILCMYLMLIVLFNGVRHSLVIFLCVPLAIIGVTTGLLLLQGSFGFMALLGFLSLTGMLIKNAIVLVDQIELEQKEGKAPYAAIMDSTVGRVRPVLLAAGTTILGMLPLLTDVFFVDMAITIMFGLGAATALTLTVVPVLYALFFRVASPAAAAPASPAAPAPTETP